jgi:catechol 2,3-dioxygenase-like lactoylglutathione lyase family enzyme
MTEFEPPIPILNVRNVPASIAYYVDRLGFKKNWDSGSPPTFASVSRGKACLFFCQDGQGHPGTWIWIPVDDVDALHAELKASGAIIRQEPTDFPWGNREMNVEDPDGHRIRFGSDSETEPEANCVPLAQ